MTSERYVLPNEMYEFERDGRYLFWDPINFTWFQTDRLGKAVMEGLARKECSGETAALVALLAGTSIEVAEVYVDKYIRQLLDIGFLHTDQYVPKRWSAGLVAHPVVMYLHLTSRCNLKCPYCYNQEHRAQLRDISAGTREQFAKLIDEAADLGFKEVKLTGGEVLLRRDTLDLARHAKTRNLRVNLLTNGTLIDQNNAREIAEVVDSVSLSLDSARPDEHDAVRGKRTHAKVVRAVGLLKNAGVKVLHLNAVMTPVNKDSVREFLPYAWEDLGAQRVTTAAATIAVDDPNQHRGAATYMLRPEEMGEVLQQRWAFEKQRFGDRPVHPMALRRSQCGAGNGVISVDSNGDLYPCQTMHIPELRCGNVFDSGLAEVLETSALLRRVKHLTPDRLEKCSSCAMRYVCAGGCRMEAYSHERRLTACNRSLCPILFRRALDKLWDAANVPAGGGPPAPRVTEPELC
ncbi:MAG: radical SAM protein [Herbaspirillum sp.]|uniref:radical SAM/SPASM domain-containing protein n=1 Tax=Herbaspirillum sp. TaxID=1890675 RepID=UPI00258CE315|nr:radical SAM protein [Herbaspirillum sp.]MCP4557382.1 radical SAM protein [Herbaspirillum sp.]